jgi:hypothetical protein
MEVDRLIHSLERQSQSAPPIITRTQENHLIEAHDWMGPDNRHAQGDTKDVVLVRMDLTSK